MLSFYFTYNQIGGVPDLFYNIALNETKQGRKVNLIARSNSYILDLFKNNFINFFFIEVDNPYWINNLTDNDTLVLTYLEIDLFNSISRNNLTLPKIHVIFWQVFPSTLLDSFSFDLRLRGLSFILLNKFTNYLQKRFISGLLRKNALIVMSQSHIDRLRKLKSSYNNIKIVPIPVSGDFHNTYLNKRNANSNARIGISYIGRAEEWKILPLQYLIERILELEDPSIISLHIFTDNVNQIRKRISCELIQNRLDIKFYENFVGKELEAVLAKEIDLSFAMGTSLLISAKLGIPTVFADASFKTIKNYRYRYLFETTGYNLGIIHDETINRKGMLLSEIIRRFADSSNYRKAISEACYNYVYENHHIDHIHTSFIQACKNSELTLSEFTKLYSLKLLQSKLTAKYRHRRENLNKNKLNK